MIPSEKAALDLICRVLGMPPEEYAGRVDALTDELVRVAHAHTDGMKKELAKTSVQTTAALHALAVLILEHTGGAPEGARLMMTNLPISSALYFATQRDAWRAAVGLKPAPPGAHWR